MRVLLTGNTGYITERFIEEAFPESQVMIMGESVVKTNRHRNMIHRTFPEEEEQIREVFQTYDFEMVVYFSNYLTFHGRTEGENENLRKILQYCKNKKEMHIVYLTGPESQYDVVTGKTLLVSTAEEFCRKYEELYQIPIKMIRIPYLYSAENKHDFIYRIFSQMEDSGRLTLQEAPQQEMFFLNSMDLADLLYKIADNWDAEEKTLNVPNVFHETFSDLGSRIKELQRDVHVICQGKAVIECMAGDDKIIRQKYGWFPRISVLEELPDLYEIYKEEKKTKEGRMAQLRHMLNRHRTVVHIAELVTGCLFFEWLVRTGGNMPQFRMIDLRLVCIVLFGSLYGMNYGIAAAAVESLSLLAAYEGQGTGWQTLFYEPSNWVPFIFYFAMGAICGYVRMKNRENIAFAEAEKNMIQDKFLFMREMYQETMQDKQLYKKQILGSKDSFGKIFDITRKLDVVQPQELYIETIRIMEEVLENKTFAFYSLKQNRGYGRLEIASREVRNSCPNSIRISDFQAAMNVLEDGEVWANREFLEGYPMYMAGIRKDGELVMLIGIKEAEHSQMTLYYLNLFKILCGLVETALLRAMEYQEATEYRQYIEGTRIMKAEYFRKRLELHQEMQEKKLACYVLLKLICPEMSLKQADEKLKKLVRENDVWGMLEDGNLYLILQQTEEAYLPVVLERLETAGLKCQVMTEDDSSRDTDMSSLE